VKSGNRKKKTRKREMRKETDFHHPVLGGGNATTERGGENRPQPGRRGPWKPGKVGKSSMPPRNATNCAM